MNRYDFYDETWRFIISIDARSEDDAWYKLSEEDKERVRYIKKVVDK